MSEILTAPSADVFCDLIAQARHYRLAGWMDGSAYCSHPCFVFRRNILLCNEWHVDRHCFAKIFTALPVKFKPWSHDPAVSGDPFPRPVNGSPIQVYSNGRWNERGPWCTDILGILDELRDEIASARADELLRQEAEKAAYRLKKEAELHRARALYGESLS